MSRENVAVVRAMLETGNAEGWRGERVLDFYDRNWVGHAVPGWPGPEQYHGHEGLRTLIAEWTTNFQNFGFELADVAVFDRGVVAFTRMHGTGRQQRVPVATEMGAIITFQSGRIAQTRFFLSWGEALEAAGLGE